MMKFGLNKETISKINSVFVKHSEIEKVIIYGSRAKGNFRNGSDVDLTLFGNELKYGLVGEINFEIDDLNTPYLFDISIYNQLTSESLKDHINRVGKIFYKKI
ncbi:MULTISPECIES: nucleotidyltransferase domain-containing protein [Flavobacterium]|uniref:Nucleotidyltransferase domain-containing protein n=2 Tax=Flavobacterium gawalongense TaxID=2594432 RepID=A0A553BR74_9FLAO|nr:nucleotidyltransferase domain-containing protein [Flavobacterium gawalongense]TRX03412.1 nucleotidyltransferase domain-containing protein [Flavobacterium gawalongense]TRX06820.1 nucleotidyltransferase domain-containing protein [Flavobacterium gawalongense]TRX10760.1 nucleotidyltransferase domain-containing protein [Flavobacterium gawalongense]TRX11483.1 nucleotidyltransferase domain-containing protein [Flavobacterium gawalongense]TRX29252.1 nucleotidyltransferase domain-containing protein [